MKIQQFTPLQPAVSQKVAPRKVAESDAPLPADSAILQKSNPPTPQAVPTPEAEPATPRPVAFQPAADLSVEAFEATNTKLAAFEGGYTKQHMATASAYANRMAEALEGTALQLTAKEARDLNEASHLYDAGKLVADEALYNDPRGPRDMPKEEWGAMWSQMCRHVEISTDRSRQLGKASDPEVEAALGSLNSKVASGDNGVREIIRHHHEKLDGTGYPDKLQGDQIPKGAQILGICDMYAALRAPRSFRPAKDHNTARSILEGDAQNGKLNPELVKTFFEKVACGG
ncbi:MAG: hypothetical protein J0I12_20455 [Candidatus Eremiobacteraeota bacterium]|nr:hypothetical protein [Candidatus Eremiobacteraeota bacterium]